MRLLLALGLSLLLAAPSHAAGSDEHRGVIEGIVRHRETRAPIEGALVVLQCSCLSATRETSTNGQGVYRFAGLPAGTYTVQFLAGTADLSKVVTLAPRSSSEPRG